MLILVALVGGIAWVGLNNSQWTGRAGGNSTPSPTVAARAGQTPQRTGGLSGPEAPTASPTSPVVIASPATALLVPSATASPTSLPPAEQTLKTLDTTGVPARDLYAIAARLLLKSSTPIPRYSSHPAGGFKTGHTDLFYMNDLQKKTYYTVTATIREVTTHAYWYVQDGTSIDRIALAHAASAFETKIYPTDRATFGSEWTPGVDNDPRITILFAPIVGAGGYYASADEYTRAVNPFSNEREIIYINTNGGWAGLESTVAHEFQHMIHWNEHPNQDVWINEGCSVLASAINGYDVLGVDGDFMRNPAVQLDAWQSMPEASRANYGASFLFFDYLRAHYGGDKIIRALLTAPAPGTGAVDEALSSLGYSQGFADVFEEWALANLVDGQPGARAAGLDYPDRQVDVSPPKSQAVYPANIKGIVTQFGTNYIQLQPPAGGSNRLDVTFSGSPYVPAIPTTAHSGDSIWWSNRGDLADTTMTHGFDLTGLSSATLSFYTWFDIEQDLDYGYAEASTDGGATWDTLKGQYTTATNPNGNSFGNGYTGKSADMPGAADGWVHEEIGLGKYAGKKLQIRFEYITDDGYNAQGMAVDDISIPELGFADDAEQDNGWQSAGFVRVANKLPEKYYLAVVKFKMGGFDVQPVRVGPDGEASFHIDGLGGGGPYKKAVLLIAGLTTHVLTQAPYTLNVTSGE